MLRSSSGLSSGWEGESRKIKFFIKEMILRIDVLQKKGGLQAGEFSLHSPPVRCSEVPGFSPEKRDSFQCPLEGCKYLHETIFCKKLHRKLFLRY
jgi:hypothetical protein